MCDCLDSLVGFWNQPSFRMSCFFCCFLNPSDICDIGVHLWFVIGSVSVIWWRQISPILPKVIECQTQPGLDSDASNVGFYTARRDGLPRPESDQQIIRPPDTSMYFLVFLKKTHVNPIRKNEILRQTKSFSSFFGLAQLIFARRRYLIWSGMGLVQGGARQVISVYNF